MSQKERAAADTYIIYISDRLSILFGSRGGIRTLGLVVMGHPSYHCSTLRLITLEAFPFPAFFVQDQPEPVH